jgi:hypothetical protein
VKLIIKTFSGVIDKITPIKKNEEALNDSTKFGKLEDTFYEYNTNNVKQNFYF